jgi:N,N-dimethylformamidase
MSPEHTRKRLAVGFGLLLLVGAGLHSDGRAQAPAQRPAPQPPVRPQTAPQEGLDAMDIVGYADHLTIQPGETIKFMVSSQSAKYRADIVRIVQADINPRGPGFKESLIDTPANGDYSGKRQALPLGSHVVVADSPALRLTGSFTLTAWIAPTVVDARRQDARRREDPG